MRALRLTAYFVLGLLLGGYAVLSYAESSPAPTVYQVKVGWNQSELDTAQYVGRTFGTWEEACALGPGIVKAGVGYRYLSQSSTNGPTKCGINVEKLINGSWYTGYSFAVFTLVAIAQCPVTGGWTLVNGQCTRPDCAADEERLNDVCVPKCAPTEVRREDGVCRPNCWGAQFYDEVANVCKCSTQQPSTTSWQVSESNAKAGKLDPPSCVNGCEQGVSTFGGLAVSFCPGGLATMVIGGSTTCYGKVGQTGATCAPGGSAPGGALIPVSVTPAPAGTGPSGAADPYSTTPNNSDPTSCAAAGGNWGVFNGQGNCYTPTPSDPAVSQSKQQNVVTKQDGSTHITTTTTTNTCTGAGACSSSTTTNTTTNNVSGGGGGGSGGMSVTTNNGAGTATGTVTKTGDGQYKIDLPKDYQKDSTGLILNAIVTDIKDVIGKPTGDDESITGAKASDESAKSVADAQEEVRQLMTGEKNIAEVSEKMTAWDQVMKEGFFEPISISGCSPFSHTFNFFATSYTWNLDHCPTAAKISEIGAYCMWVLLVFSGFRMLTTPRKEG